MIIETCPLLNEIPWIKHGFFGADNPCALTTGLCGVHPFTQDFPQAKFLKQDHTDAILLDRDDPLACIADAAITNRDNMALAIKTADCCPVLLVCTRTRHIAAIHAGWPGALNNIAAKTLETIINQGAKPDNIIAAIGPCIHPETYPVQDDVRDKFLQAQPESESYFIRFEDRWKMDVAEIVKQQLRLMGVVTTWQSPVNTFTDMRFASHRRGHQGPKLRNVSIIMKAE